MFVCSEDRSLSILALSAMPKTGLSAVEWRRRLQQYAEGNFTFGRGQKPIRSSVWGKQLAAIDSCPRHRNVSARDPFGRKIVCMCGYHSAAQAGKVTNNSRWCTDVVNLFYVVKFLYPPPSPA